MKNSWINLDDCYPPDQVPVLLCGKCDPFGGGWIEIGCYIEHENVFTCPRQDSQQLNEVHYWQPLSYPFNSKTPEEPIIVPPFYKRECCGLNKDECSCIKQFYITFAMIGFISCALILVKVLFG